MPLKSLRSRITAALLLTPGIMLLLAWIARFAGPEEAARIGTTGFLLWAFGAAFGISAIVTLYVSYIVKTSGHQ